ncbi:MAG: hypothetical protein JXR94_19070 [Candidatus Hydrogenedentes bacterium]|nr:hypothetical protein [Candidatus Hydrogenedentota bacterium]
MRVFPSYALVKRELITTLRSNRALLWLMALFLGVTSVEVNSWPAPNLPLIYMGDASQKILEFVTWTLLTGCVLFVPALAAGSVVSEREQRTFDLLHMSLVRPSAVLFAKLINAVGLYLFALAASLPVFAVLMSSVGLDQLQLALVAAQLTLICMCCASIGLLSSCLFRRSFLATYGGYAGVVLWLILPSIVILFPVWLLAQGFGVPCLRGVDDELSIILCAPVALAVILQGRYYVSEFGAICVGFAFNAALCIGCLYLALRFMKRTSAEPTRIEQEKPIDDPAVLLARRKRFPYYLIDPLRRKNPIEDAANPMRVRELRWGLLNRGSVLVRVFYCVLPVYAFAAIICVGFSVHGRYPVPNLLTWLGFEMVLLVSVAPAMLANAVTKEYELGNIDMLRMTLLSPKEIVMGKAAAGFISLAPVLAAAFIVALPVAIWQRTHWVFLAAGHGALLVCGAVSLALGLLASMLTRRTVASLILGYSMAFTAFAGLWIIGVTFVAWALDAHATFGLARMAPFLSPIGGIIAYGLDVRLENRGSYLCASLIAFVLLAYGLLKASVWIFARKRMHDQ